MRLGIFEENLAFKIVDFRKFEKVEAIVGVF